MEGVAVIRITAPPELIRNRRHKADEWEVTVINGQRDHAGLDPAGDILARFSR